MNASRRYYTRQLYGSNDSGSKGERRKQRQQPPSASWKRSESPGVILILDDDTALLRLMEIRLQREGHRVHTCCEKEQALEWLHRNKADLLFLDLKLDGEDSSDFPTKLSEHGHSIPFLVITGQGDEKIAVQMMKQGALDYLVKDIKFLDFVPAVTSRALHQIRQERQLIEAEHALRVSETKLSRAQRIAHLGSFEINLPLTPKSHWTGSQETARMISKNSFDDLLKMNLEDFISLHVHPADQSLFQQRIEQAVDSVEPIQFEFRLICRNLEVRVMQSSAESNYFHAGASGQLTGTLLDITDRRKLEEDILKISDWEKKRLGQDLHDGICQHFAGIEFMCGALEQKLQNKGDNSATRSIGDIRRLVREGIQQTRALARGLSPVEMTEDGLMDALKSLALNTKQIFRVDCEFRCESPVLIPNNETAVHLFRIAQEAVSNSIQHGKATHIIIRFHKAANSKIHLSIQDNGSGFQEGSEKGRGMGMRLIRYRSNMLGGSAVWMKNSSEDPGLTVQVICPFPH